MVNKKVIGNNIFTNFKGFNPKLVITISSYSLDNFDKAIELINLEIKTESKYGVWCYRKLAWLYYQKEEFALAKKIYENVLSKRDIGWARLGMGKVRIALGENE